MFHRTLRSIEPGDSNNPFAEPVTLVGATAVLSVGLPAVIKTRPVHVPLGSPCR